MALELVVELVANSPLSPLSMQSDFAPVRPLPHCRMCWFMAPTILTCCVLPTQLVRLLGDPSIHVRRTALRIVDRLVGKHVEELVVEVEVSSSGGETGEKSAPLVQLPTELLGLLERPFGDGVIAEPTDQDVTRVSDTMASSFIRMLKLTVFGVCRQTAFSLPGSSLLGSLTGRYVKADTSVSGKNYAAYPPTPPPRSTWAEFQAEKRVHGAIAQFVAGGQFVAPDAL
jgi:hypothetical protein